MSWDVNYIPEALDDLYKLDGSQRLLVRKAIAKVSKNPLPKEEGGLDTPLGNILRFWMLVDCALQEVRQPYAFPSEFVKTGI